MSFRTQYSKSVLPNIKWELSWNWKKTSSHIRVLLSKSHYPYPKGDHNGAVGPKYASRTKVRWRFRKILWPSQNIWTLHTYSSVEYLLGFPSDIFPILQGSLDRYSNWKYLFLNQSNSSKHEIVIWFFKFILDVFEFAKLQNFVKWISKIVHSSRVILSILWKVAFSTIFSCWPAQHYSKKAGRT